MFFFISFRYIIESLSFCFNTYLRFYISAYFLLPFVSYIVVFLSYCTFSLTLAPLYVCPFVRLVLFHLVFLSLFYGQCVLYFCKVVPRILVVAGDPPAVEGGVVLQHQPVPFLNPSSVIYTVNMYAYVFNSILHKFFSRI